MNTVTVAKKRIFVNNIEIPLIGGEIHYWRLVPENWGLVLDAVKDLGINVAASYVQWEFHEYDEGKFDFTGDTHPSRNLALFLRLLKEKGFWTILRPGPYTFTEWVNFGIPSYVAGYHRLHPKFLAAAERYIQAVSDIAKPFLASNGGNIILVNLDNQFETGDVLYGDQLGLGGGELLFQDFLGQRYGDIQELNLAWGSNYSHFSQATAIVGNVIEDPAYVRRFLDFFSFRTWYTLRYAKWLLEVFRRCGIDVPFYFNTYVDLQDQNPRELGKLVPIIGFDPYPSNEYRFVPNEHKHYLEMTRYHSLHSSVPYIAEFQSGIWHGKLNSHGVYSPNHYRLSALTSILGGVAGWNWYMLVNRDNWYQAPINEWGRKRLELTSVFKEIVDLYHEAKVPDLIRLNHTGVTFSFDQHASGTIPEDEPVLQSIYDSGIDYTFYDVDTDPSATNCKMLLYSGNQWLSRCGQQNLVEYVNRGGHLVLFQNYPRMDEFGEACNMLRIPDPYRIIAEAYVGNFQTGLQIHLNDCSGIVHGHRTISLYDNAPGTLISAKRIRTTSLDDTGSEEHEYLRSLILGSELVVGYETHLGHGTVTVLGVPPSPDLIIALHHHFQIPIFARPLVNGANLGLFQRDETYYLVAINHTDEQKGIPILLDKGLFPPGIYIFKYLGAGTSEKVMISQDNLVTLNIPAKDGVMVAIKAERSEQA